MYFDSFHEKGHTIVSSAHFSSRVDDPTLLADRSGVATMKSI